MNKTIVACIGIIAVSVSISACLCFGLFMHYQRMKDMDVTIFDKYNHCLSLTLDKSRENNKPCTLEEAEKACAKFNTSVK